jgi:hypothetical protein
MQFFQAVWKAPKRSHVLKRLTVEFRAQTELVVVRQTDDTRSQAAENSKALVTAD